MKILIAIKIIRKLNEWAVDPHEFNINTFQVSVAESPDHLIALLNSSVLQANSIYMPYENLVV